MGSPVWSVEKAWTRDYGALIQFLCRVGPSLLSCKRKRLNAHGFLGFPLPTSQVRGSWYVGSAPLPPLKAQPAALISFSY